MLQLKRRVGQRIVVDGDMVITVVQARDGTVTLSFSDDHDHEVWREEVWDRMKQEEKEDAGTGQ